MENQVNRQVETPAESSPTRAPERVGRVEVEGLLRKLIWHGADAALLLAADQTSPMVASRLVRLRRKIREDVADHAAMVESPPEWEALRQLSRDLEEARLHLAISEAAKDIQTAALEEARRDRERLDWLAAIGSFEVEDFVGGGTAVNWGFGDQCEAPTLREAIDAARQPTDEEVGSPDQTTGDDQ